MASQNKAIGKPVQAFFDSDTSEFVRRCVQHHPPHDTVSHTTGILLQADGRTATICLSVAPILWQEKASCLLLVSPKAPCPKASEDRVPITPDMTSFKLTEEVARKRDAELKLVMESVPGRIAMIRQDGTIALVNPAPNRSSGTRKQSYWGAPSISYCPSTFTKRGPVLPRRSAVHPVSLDRTGQEVVRTSQGRVAPPRGNPPVTPPS